MGEKWEGANGVDRGEGGWQATKVIPPAGKADLGEGASSSLVQR